MGRTAPDSAGSMYLYPCHALVHEVEGEASVLGADNRGEVKDERSGGTGLGFTVTNDAGDDEVRLVHDSAERDAESVP